MLLKSVWFCFGVEQAQSAWIGAQPADQVYRQRSQQQTLDGKYIVYDTLIILVCHKTKKKHADLWARNSSNIERYLAMKAPFFSLAMKWGVNRQSCFLWVIFSFCCRYPKILPSAVGRHGSVLAHAGGTKRSRSDVPWSISMKSCFVYHRMHMEYLALKVPTKYQLRAPGFSCYVFPGTRGPGHEDSRSPRGKDLRRREPECTPRIVFKNCTATTVLYWNFSSLPPPRPHPQLHQLHQHPHLGRLSFPLYFSEINPRENLAENKCLPVLIIV